MRRRTMKRKFSKPTVKTRSQSIQETTEQGNSHISAYPFLFMQIAAFLEQLDMICLFRTFKLFDKGMFMSPLVKETLGNLETYSEQPNHMLRVLRDAMCLPSSVVFFLRKMHFAFMYKCLYRLQFYLSNTVKNDMSTEIRCESTNDVKLIVDLLCKFIVRFAYFRKYKYTLISCFNENISISATWAQPKPCNGGRCRCGDPHRFLLWENLYGRARYMLIHTLYYIYDKPEFAELVHHIKTIFKETVDQVHFQPEKTLYTSVEFGASAIEFQVYATGQNVLEESAFYNSIIKFVGGVMDIRALNPHCLWYICNLLQMCNHFIDSNLGGIFASHLCHLNSNDVYGLLPHVQRHQFPFIAREILKVFKFLPNSSRNFIWVILAIVESMEGRLYTDYGFDKNNANDDPLLFRVPLVEYLSKYPNERNTLFGRLRVQDDVEKSPLVCYLLEYFKE
jgi:hypothetical protein